MRYQFSTASTLLVNKRVASRSFVFLLLVLTVSQIVPLQPDSPVIVRTEEDQEDLKDSKDDVADVMRRLLAPDFVYVS